ncbi:ABC transporter permease [Cohnella lupini]|uniref:Autoinducer 2 import system permease protein LsrD n=1 Tax=Cohnella lupini TaxID=1294267 RepID=A0A3D9ISN5_9BACL|nr:ABC transporter permease [Cohnella lupini]RED64772.1 monosaccharide ABC transporter membrane protein (CUT2 family) [Cohnella lupini]
MEPRVLANKKEFTFKSFFLQWEWLLVVLILAVSVMNASLSEYFLEYDNLRDATMGFLDKAFIVLPMVFIILMGDIDISVASIVTLSSVIMADLFNHGLPMGWAMVAGLAVGTICGWINGMLVVRFKELSSVIVTLATMIIYRGIAYILLKDQASGKFPDWFQYLGWEYIGGIPFILIAFAVCAIGFGWLLHKTVFGRRVYAIGNNATASRYSGVQVDKIKVLVFTLAGLMSAVTAMFLTSRMGSTRPNIASGYELEVIAMVVLGGISTAGGKGRMIGAILAVFLIGFLRYGLGLVNVSAQMLLIILGLLLILSVAIPQLKQRFASMRRI